MCLRRSWSEQALVRTAQTQFEEYAQYGRISADVMLTIANGGALGYLADYIAQNIPIDYEIKQEILEELNVNRRLAHVIRVLGEEIEILKIESDIQDQLKAAVDKNQKDYYLREQIKVIQSELGEQDIAGEAEEYRDHTLPWKPPYLNKFLINFFRCVLLPR